MPRGARLTVFIIYVAAALAAPLLIVLFPGERPLRLNSALLEVREGAFATPKQALGDGAESYQLNVLHDLDERLAGAAAVYPDGGSALIARFASEQAAQAAANTLIEMIPHKALMSDLWATRFQSDSGEFVVITTVDDVLIFIIADTEVASAERLASLPALIYNTDPGFGAVLATKNPFEWLAWLAGYLFFQLVAISRLASWVAKRTPAKGTPAQPLEVLRDALHELAGEGYEVMRLPNGDINISWKISEAMRETFHRRGTTELVSLHLEFDPKAATVRALCQKAHFDWQVGVGDELLEGGKATLSGLAWENRHYVPLLAAADGGDGADADGYQAHTLYAAVARVVLSQGWGFRPVVSFSRFISG